MAEDKKTNETAEPPRDGGPANQVVQETQRGKFTRKNGIETAKMSLAAMAASVWTYSRDNIKWDDVQVALSDLGENMGLPTFIVAAIWGLFEWLRDQ